MNGLCQISLWHIAARKSFSYATSAFDTNKPIVPVDLIHEVTAYRGIGVLYKIGVCAIE